MLSDRFPTRHFIWNKLILRKINLFRIAKEDIWKVLLGLPYYGSSFHIYKFKTFVWPYRRQNKRQVCGRNVGFEATCMLSRATVICCSIILWVPWPSFVISKYCVPQTYHMVTSRIVNNKYVGRPDELSTQRRLRGDIWENNNEYGSEA